MLSLITRYSDSNISHQTFNNKASNTTIRTSQTTHECLYEILIDFRFEYKNENMLRNIIKFKSEIFKRIRPKPLVEKF